MTDALIVAHGQPADPAPQQAAVEALAARVATLLPGLRIAGATLAMPGAIEAAGPGARLIYPMFMAEGWFTTRELPRRLARAGVTQPRILAPFGADPGLGPLCLRLLSAAAEAQGWRARETAVLIAAHGSGRSPAPARAAHDLALHLAPAFAHTRCAFIEQDPPIAAAASELPARAICLPFFATRAGHVTDDLPAALARAGFAGPTLPPLGLAAEIPAMIAASIRAAHEARP